MTKDQVQDRTTKDPISILDCGDQNQGQIIGDFHREHQQDKTAGVHREMDLETEMTRKSL